MLPKYSTGAQAKLHAHGCHLFVASVCGKDGILLIRIRVIHIEIDVVGVGVVTLAGGLDEGPGFVGAFVGIKPGARLGQRLKYQVEVPEVIARGHIHPVGVYTGPVHPQQAAYVVRVPIPQAGAFPYAHFLRLPVEQGPGAHQHLALHVEVLVQQPVYVGVYQGLVFVPLFGLPVLFFHRCVVFIC